ncbi:hypothetical protein HC028_05985 [Planosporangium flavigriseum]|uniref:Uncharacterized protein n=1 Tax=Planosporangium flavigriseum TaxID=373681 RepID=A0A8J3LLV5_9ACTN|nr:rhomboid-like protein [Planosporangium flavigriseum]NJC64062.1 hypothetical protein [Planosporangium flavigriseum]GIG72943.1 hypothetical protein Pfl04_13470 [Planosporangium flavigriseum]
MRSSAGRIARQFPARAGVTIGYTATFVATTLVFRGLPVRDRTAWLAWTSTNLENLRDHPLPALVASGLFTEGSLVGWALLGLVGLGVTNRALGNWRTAALVVSAHVGGTLISQGILAYRIASGHAAAADRYITDVGPSYVVTCALVAGAVYGAGVQRLAAAGGFVLFAPTAFPGLSDLVVSSVGHLCAVVFGVALGWPLWRSARRRAAGAAVARTDKPGVSSPKVSRPALVDLPTDPDRAPFGKLC